ncbi:MAG: AAA family ATPase [Deltaproteobacteria bacterium]|nr:MAG: AAA family ATPase [Deltaproteobacteria bacterium]
MDGELKMLDQKELEKELNDYLHKKYGVRIRIVTPMMLAKAAQKGGEEKSADSNPVDKIQFDMKPEELVAHLDEYVVKQDEAKAILATKVCTHFNRIRRELENKCTPAQTDVGRIKNNIIMIGPTGVGKTYIVKLIANKLGVPFVKGDATKFSETGYVGGDVEDLVRDLVREANEDIELAQYGIVYLDEIDKIASSTGFTGPDVSRTGVQRALLKPMEETEVNLKVPHDAVSQLQALEQYRKTGEREKRVINTRNILFIVSGAFNELSDIIKKRVGKKGMGFGADLGRQTEKECYPRMVMSDDLVQYGFESEFVGRLPVTTVLNRLTADDLYAILKNPKNPVIRGKKEDFRAYDIDIRFEDEALKQLSQQAFEENTGARGLVRVMEKALVHFEKKLPTFQVSFFVVTPEVVTDPETALEQLLEDPDSPALRERYQQVLAKEKAAAKKTVLRQREYFEERYGSVFNDAYLDLIAGWHLSSGAEVEDLFREVTSMVGEVKAFESEFMARQHFRIRFSDDALYEILSEAVNEGTDVATICRRVSSNYDYSMRLAMNRTGQEELVLPREAILNPKDFVNGVTRSSHSDSPFAIPGSHGE